MAVLRPKKAWRSLGDLAESPSTDAQTGPLMVGTARRTAPISLTCPINNSYEGWPRARRMIASWRVASEGRSHCLETLAHPLSAQHQPLHRRAQVDRYGVGSEQPRREPARSQVTLQDAVDLLAFTASLPVPPDHLISRKVSVGHQPGDLRLRRPASSRGRYGEISGDSPVQGSSCCRLPLVRTPPTVDGPWRPAVRGMPCSPAELRRHVESYRARSARLCPRRSTAATRADTQPRPTGITLSTAQGRCSNASVNTRSC